MLFIVTWLELSVSFTGKLSVVEFSGYHFQYAPTWQNWKNEVLKNSNFYLLESVRLGKCCFGKNLMDGDTFEKINMKPMRWINENKKLHCIFYFILFYFWYGYEKLNKLKKNLRLFFVLPRIFITQVKGKRCTNRKLNSSTSGIQHNFLKRMPQQFGATNTLMFSSLTFPKLNFPTYA